MNYAFYLGRKVALGSSGRKASPGVKVATAAIALSIAVMIASIAIVLGFKREITDKVLGFTSHIVISVSAENEGDNIITLTPTLKKILDSQDYIKDYSLQISIPAILKTPEDFKGIFLKTLADRQTREFLNSNLISGSIPDYSQDSTRLDIVMSRMAANQLGLKQDDKVDCYFINDDVKVRRLKIAGIYDSHFDAYDDLMVYGSRALSEAFTGLNANQGSSILITTTDFRNIDAETAELQNTFHKALAEGLIYKNYYLENAHVQGANYFQWLSMLDTNVIVVLTLMIIVGCVTLVSGMLTIILDKKRFIGLIKALGAPNGKVREVFIYLAMRVAIVGILIGNLLIIGVLLFQDHFHFFKLDASSYYIDFVPVELNWVAFGILNVGVVVLVYLTLILPSRIISNISPSSTMRSE
ncbi:MAG: FtsX-like permease family protein [Muribaculaceae bacterium]|nr:FtsX-like permease family protein [Muribaculaceae bacterium]